jgi:hypothetical protein
VSITITMTNKQARLAIDALISARTRRRRPSIEEMSQDTAHNLYELEHRIYEAFAERAAASLHRPGGKP